MQISLGASLLGRGDFKGCLDYFQSAVKFGDAPMGALNNLGLAQYQQALAQETEETSDQV